MLFSISPEIPVLSMRHFCGGCTWHAWTITLFHAGKGVIYSLVSSHFVFCYRIAVWRHTRRISGVTFFGTIWWMKPFVAKEHQQMQVLCTFYFSAYSLITHVTVQDNSFCHVMHCVFSSYHLFWNATNGSTRNKIQTRQDQMDLKLLVWMIPDNNTTTC